MTEEMSLPDGVTPEELAEALRLVQRNKARGGAEETIHVRGEGGAVFEMAPSRMSADMRRRMQMGRLRRVNPDGSPYRPYTPTGEPTPADAGGSALTQGRVPRPAKSAPKKDWVLYAVAELGLDEERALEMTRQELIDLPPDHAAHPDLVPDGDTPTAAPGGGRPDAAAPKAAWIDHIVKQGLLSREDAEAYTKADLIAMVS